MYCKKCGNLINDDEQFCPKCGTSVADDTSVLSKTPKTGSRWVLGKTIIGALSLVLSVIVFFQSAAVGLGNMLTDSGEISGTAGLLMAILFFTAGLVGLISRKSEKKSGPMACGIMYWLGFFFSRMFSGSYSDLRVWGIIAYIFGAIMFFSTCRSKKGYIICAVLSVIYLVLGLA